MKDRNGKTICMLKQMRRSRGLSQARIAELVGVKRQAIYDIESGRYMPNTAVALRLARHLGCRVEDLFSEESLEPVHHVFMAEGRGLLHRGFRWPRCGDVLWDIPWMAGTCSAMNCAPRTASSRSGGDRVRLFATPEHLDKTILLLGCDPAFSLLAAHVARTSPSARIACRFASSYRALEGLSAGQAHIAGTHLHSSTSEDSNVQAARARLSGVGGLVVGYSVMQEGLMVAPGNPHGIRSAADLAKEEIRMVNREEGAALRVLLDDHLAECPHSSHRGEGL